MSEADSAAQLAMAATRIRELEEQVRTLYRRLTDRAESLPNLLPKFYRPDEIPAFDGRDEAPVDLLLTVKDSHDFLVPCLESVLANTDIPFRLFLNDNASSDPRTPKYLQAVRDRHPDHVRLFLQRRDLGFTDAVNLLLGETTNDVIMINADTVMPPGWAQRLLWPLRHSSSKVATATPFANSGPYVAFPRIGEDVDLFGGLKIEALDRVFQSVRPEAYFTMPVGFGFCMAASRRALDEIGPLDADTFRPGYGEETDWCCRASARGYAHALVPNLFVYHKHGATFGRQPADARDKLIASHHAIIMQRYPDFENRLHAFVDDPDYLAMRGLLLFLASAAAGGGVAMAWTSYDRLDRCAVLTKESGPERPFLAVAQHPETGEFFLRFRWQKYGAAFTSPNYNWVIKMLYRVKVSAVRVDPLPPLAESARIRRALERLAASEGIVVEYREAEG